MDSSVSTGKQHGDRQVQILQAAIPIFAASGFSDAGIAEIAAAAGVSFGSVHYHFGSKNGLFERAVLEPLAQLEAALTVPSISPEGLLDALAAMVREHIRVIIANRTEVHLLTYVLSQRDRFPDLTEAIARFGERMRGRLIPLVEEGIRRGELAPGDVVATSSGYLAYVIGLSQVVILDPEARIWDDYGERGMRILGALR